MRKLSAAMRRMTNDPDIQVEARATGEAKAEAEEDRSYPESSPASFVPLNVVNQAHRPSAKTAQMVHDVGGLAVLRRFTSLFYEKAFADPVLDKFIRSHDDPHGERFATWIAEKMGVGTPWSDERRTPGSRCPFHDARTGDMLVHDRSSAHFAAWHSPKREPAQFGRHFNLAECRLWMRLHFSAAREAGVFAASPRFADYYVRFIGHFVSVYEGTAPAFARESARWSADPANIQAYLDAGRRMLDVAGSSPAEAFDQLPPHERTYTGSTAGNAWPYELR